MTLRSVLSAGVSLLMGLVVLADVACTGSHSDGPPDVLLSGDTARTTTELISFDWTFAAESREKGAERWPDVWSEQGRLQWMPQEAGMWWEDAGWTAGRWWIRPLGGGEPADTGYYVTGWVRADGTWKVSLHVSVPDCSGVPGAREFDFWVGNWSVSQRIRGSSGWEDYTARSSVRPVADGCLLVENWNGTVRFEWEGMDEPSAMRGGSVRLFDTASDSWRIQWIDDRSYAFGAASVGTFEGTTGVFQSTGARPTRIVFDRHDPTEIEWRLEIPGDSEFVPIWIMMFTPL